MNHSHQMEARIFKTCVGKEMYLSHHHRPNTKHNVNTLSRTMTNPTTKAMRRLKKLTRYLLQELCPDPHAETLQVPVDSDWADDKETRQSCRGGAVLFHGCAVLTWARTQKTRALPRVEAKLYGIGSRNNRRIGSSTVFTRMVVQNSTASSDRVSERTCGVQTKRAWSNGTHQTEDAHSASMAENNCRLTTTRQIS